MNRVSASCSVMSHAKCVCPNTCTSGFNWAMRAARKSEPTALDRYGYMRWRFCRHAGRWGAGWHGMAWSELSTGKWHLQEVTVHTIRTT